MQPSHGPETISIRPLRSTELDAVADFLSHAFFDDPGSAIIEPEPASRLVATRALFAVELRHGLNAGHVDVTDDLQGVAVWLPPERNVPTEQDLRGPA
ncbi:MAG: hypothetical protein LC792_14695 [Actinobacteria bacterium]|nr:hypothetical protein [Actinomycetota bacterium]